MKEYINRLSVGKFKMDTPDIIKPDETVVAEVLCGTYSDCLLYTSPSPRD